MFDSGRLQKSLSRSVLLLIIVSLCWALGRLLTESPITKDARQNLQAAYNLSAWGVCSIESSVAAKPPADNYREPLVPFVTSLLMRFYKGVDPGLALEDFSTGALCRAVKQVNIFWAFFLLLGAAVMVISLTGSSVLAALAGALIWLTFLRNPAYIDTLCTEIPTATLMVWVSVVLARGLPSGSRVLFFGAGLLLGFLQALTQGTVAEYIKPKQSMFLV